MASIDRDAPGPDFICFGMQRAGTRWLYDQLAAHPDTWMPPVKEIGHFNHRCFKPANRPDRQKYTPHGHEQLTAAERAAFFRKFTPEQREADGDRWYRGLFAAKQDRISGDISPEYAALRGDSIPWVAEVCPEARYLILIRDPVERFWSAANLHLRLKHYAPEQLQSWPVLRDLLMRPLHRRRSYPSRIWRHWSSVAPADRRQFFFYDDIRDRPADARRAIFGLLGLDPAKTRLPPDFNRKAEQTKLPLPPQIRRRLARRFMPEYEACAETFGGPALAWLQAARELAAQPSYPDAHGKQARP